MYWFTSMLGFTIHDGKQSSKPLITQYLFDNPAYFCSLDLIAVDPSVHANEMLRILLESLVGVNKEDVRCHAVMPQAALIRHLHHRSFLVVHLVSNLSTF